MRRVRAAFVWFCCGFPRWRDVLADWGLRITALLEARHLPRFNHASAWYLVTAVFIAPFVVLAPLHGSLSNGLAARWVLVASSI